MADWNTPVLGTAYATFLQAMKDRDLDAATQFYAAVPTNPANNMIRFVSANNRWERYNGTAWVELSTAYALKLGSGSTINATPIGATTASTGAFTTLTANTPAAGDNSTNVATTAWVAAKSYATLASPALTGTPTAPTAATATNTTQIATTAFVKAQGYATLASPTFTGTPAAPTAAQNDNSTKLATTAYVDRAAAGANPLLFPIWCPSRAAIPTGYAPADGQTLTRATYPDAWALVNTGKVPTVAEATWQSTPTERGKYTIGDGSTTFRLPDYNGKTAGSPGSLFLRGDGTNAAGEGVIQLDAMQGHKHSHASNNNGGPASDTVTVTAQQLGNFTGWATTTTAQQSIGIVSDGTNGTPRTAGETRPMNVGGCWIVRVAGTSTNAGSVDAVQLATDVATLKAAWFKTINGTAPDALGNINVVGIDQGYSAIGALVIARCSATVQAGGTTAGTNITPSNGDGSVGTVGVLSGTWRCLGYANSAGSQGDKTTLFQRIA